VRTAEPLLRANTDRGAGEHDLVLDRTSSRPSGGDVDCKDKSCPSRLMLPKLPPSGPGSLKTNLGTAAVNVGEVATSTDITSSSLDSRFWPRKKDLLSVCPPMQHGHHSILGYPPFPFAGLHFGGVERPNVDFSSFRLGLIRAECHEPRVGGEPADPPPEYSSHKNSIPSRAAGLPVCGTTRMTPPESRTKALPSGEMSLGATNAPGVSRNTNSSTPLPSESLR